MSNTLVFDYAVSIDEAQTATRVDYSFLNRCLVMVKGKFSAEPPEEESKSASKKSAKASEEKAITDPSLYKVVPIYDSTLIANYTDNTEVPFLMKGGLESINLLILAAEVDPTDEDAIGFDPTDYFTLCFSADMTIEEAQAINFADFDGPKVYATADKALAEELNQTETAFLENSDSYQGAYEEIGHFLSRTYFRNCQYHVLSGDNETSTIWTVGEAGDLFNKRISFFLNGSDGPTLGFFGNGGHAITKRYVDRLIHLEVQEAITAYIQTNEPNNTAVQRVNIEEAAAAVITKYEGYPYFYLDPDADNYINIMKSNELYYVNGAAKLKDAEPIWRAQIEVTEAS
ncbi:hypothetical protein ACP6H1_21735 [Vibrio harveyi]|uniref:hypothetical protein n=1 Tax=Vibrio harveyi TaxID=669 RepID=UPI003CF5AE0B